MKKERWTKGKEKEVEGNSTFTEIERYVEKINSETEQLYQALWP